LPQVAAVKLTTLVVAGAALVAIGGSAHAEGSKLRVAISGTRESAANPATNAVDGNMNTVWLADAKPAATNNVAEFTLSLPRAQRLARLHWIAAKGDPYPAWGPTEYEVSTSLDGRNWTTRAAVNDGPVDQVSGSTVLNVTARYVRLRSTKVGDGTGWALGLREVWVTQGQYDGQDPTLVLSATTNDASAVTVTVRCGRRLTESKTIRLTRSDAPTANGTIVEKRAFVDSAVFVDRIAHWTPQYYRAQVVDSAGKVAATSNVAVGLTRPGGFPAPPPEVFAFWYQDYVSRRDPNSTLRRIGNSPLVIGPNATVAGFDVNEAGRALLPYLTLYQSSRWAPMFPRNASPEEISRGIEKIAFFNPAISFVDGLPGYVPTIFSRPNNVEYDARRIQFTVCPNSTDLHAAVLAFAQEQLERGASGFFVDSGFNDDLAAYMQCVSHKHKHWYGEDLTGAQAFLGLLLDLASAVKRHKPNGLVLVNDGVPSETRFYGSDFWSIADGQLWEAFLRTSHADQARHVVAWNYTFNRALRAASSRRREGRQTYVLSFPWDRDEAFLCYATAKLFDFPWSAGIGDKDKAHQTFGGFFGTFPDLLAIRLGRPQDERDGGDKIGEVYVRKYSAGMVIVNPTATAHTATVPLGAVRRYSDVYLATSRSGPAIIADVPANSGRVYLWQ
jgi:hypothetical protein